MDYRITKSDELYHHGVKGMHWGIRRYQPYPDGKSGKFVGKKPKDKKGVLSLFNLIEFGPHEYIANEDYLYSVFNNYKYFLNLQYILVLYIGN